MFEPDRLFALGFSLTPSVTNRGWVHLEPEELNHLLPQYRIGKIVGCGCMGAVYQGSQEQLGHNVVIKLLPVEMAA